MTDNVRFAVGGAVQNKQGTYLKRPADEELFMACQSGEFTYVLACRQIGKSSLMIEAATRLAEADIKTVWIDLNGIGQAVSVDEWYFSLIDTLAERLKLKTDIPTWWEARPDLTAIPARFLQFFRDVVLQEIQEQIVIFIDEIDVTLGLPFTDDFFAAIRTIYTERMREPAYERLTFVLLGVATPDELIKDHTRTPFNIGRAIDLRDFTEEECHPFQLKIESAHPSQGVDYFEQIYGWTNGHPYLTQRLCQEIITTTENNNLNLVDTLVREIFLIPKARGDDNIQFVQTRVTNDPYAQTMIRLYKRILENKEPVLDDEQSPAINRLKLYGLVVSQEDKLQVRNKIYAHAFDKAWANETLNSMRLGLPYTYTILQRIDQRGFSTVYLAQTQGADGSQLVVLKVLQLPQEMEDDWTQELDRLQQTIQTVIGFDHPNIVKIFETGRIDERTMFIAMEYVAGGRLRDKLQDDPLSRAEAVEIVKQIGLALMYSHQQGILHLAVSPNDILVDTQQKPARLVLTDFGYTKLLHDASQTQSIHNYEAIDPRYLAPEYGQQNTQSSLLDMHGLALTFFEALAGELPENRQPDEPLLPPLSEQVPDLGPFFDDTLYRATAAIPTDRFETLADFIAGVETANEKAEEVEQSERQMRAASVVEATQSYIAKGRYDPDKAMNMIEAALEIFPDYSHALRLRGRIWQRQGEIDKALADYRQAYAQVQELSSDVGIEFLEILNQAADTSWQHQMLQEAVRYYEEIWQILKDQPDETDFIRKARQTAHARLVEYHHRGGEIAYALNDPKEIDERIRILEEQIESLDKLEAISESKDLQTKLQELRVKKYEHVIAAAQEKIDELNTKESHIRYSSDDIFEHYATLDQAYKWLIQLEPEQQQWSKLRRRKLKEMAKARSVFAVRALNKLEPDYEAALKHYKTIFDLKDNGYPSIARDLGLNLDQKIAELEKIIDYDGKYREIQMLMNEGEHLKALERLDQEFIQTGNYEHRDVAKMLWGLVYAKQNRGKLPPEWEGLSIVGALSDRLVEVEQKNIRHLETKLEPWSQINILKTVDRENKRLQNYEEQVQSLETLLNDAVVHGVAESPNIEGCRTDLVNIENHIQEQRDILFQINVDEAVQKVEAWLQKLEDLNALAQTNNPVDDTPVFLNSSDECQQMIKRSSTFETLQAILSTNAEIKQMIDNVKLNIQERLPWVLIEDIGRKDEQITSAKREVANIKEQLAKVQQEAAIEHQKVIKFQQNKGARIARNLLITAGAIAAIINLLIVFLFWNQFTSLAIWVLTLPFIIILMTGIALLTFTLLRRKNTNS